MGRLSYRVRIQRTEALRQAMSRREKGGWKRLVRRNGEGWNGLVRTNGEHWKAMIYHICIKSEDSPWDATFLKMRRLKMKMVDGKKKMGPKKKLESGD
jgi:hypothetical protein